jgi:hypothetical protein
MNDDTDIKAAEEGAEMLELVRGKLGRVYRAARTTPEGRQRRRFYDTISTVAGQVATAAELLRRAGQQARE